MNVYRAHGDWYYCPTIYLADTSTAYVSGGTKMAMARAGARVDWSICDVADIVKYLSQFILLVSSTPF